MGGPAPEKTGGNLGGGGKDKKGGRIDVVFCEKQRTQVRKDEVYGKISRPRNIEILRHSGTYTWKNPTRENGKKEGTDGKMTT